ncbi:MAG: hypothetical protein H0U04_08575 [Rubrobacter sp.]|nr:hypothetical protein [Rubrobacter sp.]
MRTPSAQKRAWIGGAIRPPTPAVNRRVGRHPLLGQHNHRNHPNARISVDGRISEIHDISRD